ncbi:hypothetical protein FRC17_009474 [Serendipita sp. 399]|nr:hypothetical protein FRC17_009474 [Serendipita sp. 399]
MSDNEEMVTISKAELLRLRRTAKKLFSIPRPPGEAGRKSTKRKDGKLRPGFLLESASRLDDADYALHVVKTCTMKYCDPSQTWKDNDEHFGAIVAACKQHIANLDVYEKHWLVKEIAKAVLIRSSSSFPEKPKILNFLPPAESDGEDISTEMGVKASGPQRHKRKWEGGSTEDPLPKAKKQKQKQRFIKDSSESESSDTEKLSRKTGDELRPVDCDDECAQDTDFHSKLVGSQRTPRSPRSAPHASFNEHRDRNKRAVSPPSSTRCLLDEFKGTKHPWLDVTDLCIDWENKVSVSAGYWGIVKRLGWSEATPKDQTPDFFAAAAAEIDSHKRQYAQSHQKNRNGADDFLTMAAQKHPMFPIGEPVDWNDSSDVQAVFRWIVKQLGWKRTLSNKEREQIEKVARDELEWHRENDIANGFELTSPSLPSLPPTASTPAQKNRRENSPILAQGLSTDTDKVDASQAHANEAMANLLEIAKHPIVFAGTSLTNVQTSSKQVDPKVGKASKQSNTKSAQKASAQPTREGLRSSKPKTD